MIYKTYVCPSNLQPPLTLLGEVLVTFTKSEDSSSVCHCSEAVGEIKLMGIW